jgi:sugar phosphate isomerase/epimerase
MSKSNLSSYARIGLVHHMLYARCVNDPEYHVRTLEEFVRRTDIETLDCCLPYGKEREDRCVRAIRASGKEHVVFATHLFPLRKLTFASTSYSEQAQVRILVADMVRQAVAMGSTGFIFASGGPPFAEGTKANHDAFFDFCRWLCGELAPHGIDALIEPFDFDFDKKFLYGPLDRNIDLVKRLSHEFPNIGIELDVAHLPLMREDFASSIRRSAPWLKRVHLGNCMKRDTSDPFYGDKHPPIGYAGGEIDVPELVEILAVLREVGFLDTKKRGDLVLELNPFPGRSEDESVADNLARVERAWDQVLGAVPA